jgi:endoribonuclease LACTB2
LIDSSGGPTIGDYIDLLSKELSKRNCSIQEILITHWHWDHTDGVQHIFKNVTKSPVRVSKFALVDQPEYDEVTKYNYINDNHIFETEGATIKAIYTPGHTKDHLSFYLNEENSLFSGDCILGETTAEFEDLYDYMNSLRRILGLQPQTIYPGHGPVVKDAVTRVGQYIEHRNKRNNQIVEALRKSKEPRDVESLVREIYVVDN